MSFREAKELKRQSLLKGKGSYENWYGMHSNKRQPIPQFNLPLVVTSYVRNETHQNHWATSPLLMSIFQPTCTHCGKKHHPAHLNLTAGLGPVCRETKIIMLRQVALLQHVFSDLQTLPIKILQMSCLISTPAWQQQHFQSLTRQHCPLLQRSEMKHCGGAESRLKEEPEGSEAYYRDGNATQSFIAWTCSLHLFTGAVCNAWHKIFLWMPKHFLYNKSSTPSSLLPMPCYGGTEKQQHLAGIYTLIEN